MTITQAITSRRIASAKKELRAAWLQLNAMIDARGADCGMQLLGYISAECQDQARRVVDMLADLRRIDPWECPPTPAWVVTLAGGKERTEEAPEAQEETE